MFFFVFIYFLCRLILLTLKIFNIKQYLPFFFLIIKRKWRPMGGRRCPQLRQFFQSFSFVLNLIFHFHVCFFFFIASHIISYLIWAFVCDTMKTNRIFIEPMASKSVVVVWSLLAISVQSSFSRPVQEFSKSRTIRSSPVFEDVVSVFIIFTFDSKRYTHNKSEVYNIRKIVFSPFQIWWFEHF